MPLNEGTAATQLVSDSSADADAVHQIGFNWAAGDYFAAMEIELLEGRLFRREEQEQESSNVVVSRTAAEQLWPNENPLGRQLQAAGAEVWQTVIGVVDDVVQNDLREPAEAVVYLPLVSNFPEQRPIQSPAYVVRTARALDIAPEVRALVREHAPSAPMYRVFTMSQLVDESMVQLTFTMLTLAIAACLALVLGAIGIYGVLSYVVTERTREIGLRMAMGAAPGRVRRMVVAQGLRVVLTGVVVGVVVSLVATRALGGLLYGVEALDPMTFVAMSLAMLLIGLLATYLPARRASAVDPIRSLRAE